MTKIADRPLACHIQFSRNYTTREPLAHLIERRDVRVPRCCEHDSTLAKVVRDESKTETTARAGDQHGLRRRPHRASQPPSTATTWPCTYAAAGEARNTTAPPMSSGVPQRPAGMRAEICADRAGSYNFV